ncbi:hypothetical protein HZC30_01235 [Candidatus Woesearchaeota archaeon]|nr:hypothetical protein [Candidatus Woesearchaeota archaeon]
MDIETKTEDALRGQPFIAEHDEEGHLRDCSNCFYGVQETRNPGGIKYAEKCLTEAPKKLFGANPLPRVLDDKQVAHYCPHFNDYSNFEEI